MKRNHKFILLTAFVLLLSVTMIGCGSNSDSGVSYQYYTAEELKEAIENDQPVFILDVQVEEEFEQHHIVGAVPTYAFPTETDEQKERVISLIPEMEATDAPVVIVCPRGGGGATRAIDALTEAGFPVERLFILEKGQQNWPYEELLAE